MVGGAALKIAGPVAAVATAAWAAGKAFNFVTGVSGKEAEAKEKVAKAAERAASELDKVRGLTPEDKEDLTKTAAVSAKRIRNQFEKGKSVEGFLMILLILIR